MKRDLEKLLDKMERKEILITNTFEKDSFAYLLAHIIRLSARTTYCVDERYLMKNEPEGYRIIESGKVVLIKGNLENDRERIYNIIKQLDGKVDYEIIVNKPMAIIIAPRIETED